MKFQKVCVFLGLTFIFIACSEQSIVSAPTSTPIDWATSTFISQPSLNSPTPTFTPDACSRQTIPSEINFSDTPEPNNKLIALGTKTIRDYGGEVYVTNMDGNIIKNLTNHQADDTEPSWSPNGKQLAFLSNRITNIPMWCIDPSDDCIYQLFSMNPDGTDLRQITPDWTSQYSWSPDGKQIVFLRAVKLHTTPSDSDSFLYEVYKVNSDGTNLRNLTNFPGIYPFGPIWSPDGTKIAFVSAQKAMYPYSINIIRSDGAEQLTYSLKANEIIWTEIVWTADSKSLLFTSELGNGFVNDIYKLQIDTSDVTRITFAPNTRKEHLALSPDGKWLAYHSLANDQCDQIRIVNIETMQNYFVYDAYDVGKAILETSRGTIAPSYDSLSIQSTQWMPNGKELLFNQTVRFGVILGEFDESFSIRLDGTSLREFGEKSGLHSFQP
ncbi:MAG: hypothetical protein L6461_15390 [Anaerolineae bacterium]|nr:hypothetical protein [Anaerolineae bacterium]